MKKLALGLALLSGISFATERKFSYTYQTATLPEGAKEVEVWNTHRFGNDSFISILDQRLELEWGMANNSQMAIYLNSRSTRSPVQDQNGQWIKDGNYIQLQDEYAFKGFSLEFKQQLLNPDLNPVGFAYYLEAGVQASELELEGKLLFDKSFGKFTTALNLEGEVELEYEAEPEGSEVKTEVEVEEKLWAADLGLNYAVTERFGLGIETRVHGVHTETEDLLAVFAGPSVQFGGKEWWAVLSVLPQLTKEYEDHQKIESRLLVGLHF